MSFGWHDEQAPERAQASRAVGSRSLASIYATWLAGCRYVAALMAASAAS